MKSLLHTILAAILVALATGSARAASGDLFIYPTPPDTMMALQPRCDYIVLRFWDRCNFGTAFDKYPAKLNAAFGDWIGIMPHASADSVHTAIERLLKRFEKKGPETLALVNMAENWLYSDTAQFFSTEVYLPFVKAAVANKKISKADRARFEHQQRILETASLGSIVPPLPVIKADGSKGNLGEFNAGSLLYFFNDPDCLDCVMARIRLSADPNCRELIDRGELAVVSIFPGDTDEEGWEKARAAADDRWHTVAMPDAADYFDLRSTPLFIFLNRRHKVLATGLDIDYLLGAFQEANLKSKRLNEQQQ